MQISIYYLHIFFMYLQPLFLLLNQAKKMSINSTNYTKIITELNNTTTLVAVSKTKPIEDITALYNLGQRHFGENYVQELVDKQLALPKDILWHFIGHLQSNKVKLIAPFVYLIHGVDSLNLLQVINKEAAKNNRVINCLLQIHIATEDTKFGFDENEVLQLKIDGLKNINIAGVMGMASFTQNVTTIRNEFKQLKNMFNQLKNNPNLTVNKTNFNPQIISMGMSGDYAIAIEEGSTMVRIGSLLFGQRKVQI